MEARPGIEPGCKDLQSSASPLRHRASMRGRRAFLRFLSRCQQRVCGGSENYALFLFRSRRNQAWRRAIEEALTGLYSISKRQRPACVLEGPMTRLW